MDGDQRTPIWMIVVIIIAMLPGLAFPTLLSRMGADPDTEVKAFVWFYPVYVLLAGWFAYRVYPDRRALSWVLVALLVFTHIAMWMLV